MGTDVDNRAQRFRELIEPLLNDAYTFARYLARDPSAADDIVQEASLRAFRHLESLRNNDARAWMMKIVRNCFFAWRGKVVQAGLRSIDTDLVSDDGGGIGEPDFAEHELDPHSILENTVKREAVRQIIESLPVQYREALVLRELN